MSASAITFHSSMSCVLVVLLLVMLGLAGPSARAESGETLYNGIRLPAAWPPALPSRSASGPSTWWWARKTASR